MKMQEWVTSVKCHTPSRCTVCCTQNTEAICLELPPPSPNLLYSSQFPFPVGRAGTPKAICFPPASFETSSFSSPYFQRPLHSGILPQQTHSGLYGSEKFLPLTSNSSKSIAIILSTKANRHVDSGAIIILLSLFNQLQSFMSRKTLQGMKSNLIIFNLSSPQIFFILSTDHLPLGLHHWPGFFFSNFSSVRNFSSLLT